MAEEIQEAVCLMYNLGISIHILVLVNKVWKIPTRARRDEPRKAIWQRERELAPDW